MAKRTVTRTVSIKHGTSTDTVKTTTRPRAFDAASSTIRQPKTTK